MEISKDYLQERGIRAFEKAGGFLMVEFSMGVGKTLLAIHILKALTGGFMFRKTPCLFICHTTISRDVTIPNEFRKWGCYELIEQGKVKLVQYEALDSISNESFPLVIFDEAHLITQRRCEFFSRNKCLRILLLTGTRPDNTDKMNMLRRLCKGNILSYDIVQATKHGTVNDVIFKMVYVEMNPWENQEYARLCDKVVRAQKGMPATAWQLTLAVNQRMWFIYKSATKLQAMKYLAQGMREKNRRFLMFTTTKELARELSAYTMYSGKTDKDFHLFCQEEINELCSVKQIEGGANIPNLRYGINQQINSKKHNIRQIAGRLLRGDVHSPATLWIIVLRSTIDEVWVNNAMDGIPKGKIKKMLLKREEFQQIIIE